MPCFHLAARWEKLVLCSMTSTARVFLESCVDMLQLRVNCSIPCGMRLGPPSAKGLGALPELMAAMPTSIDLIEAFQSNVLCC